MAGPRVPWRRRMDGRDPQEAHRASTPLELLFDLCFVVAVAQAAAQLAHGIEEQHTVAAVGGFAMVIFAIWWAWMNFTWFASAYDVDDVPYRLLTLLQMAGVLILAAGVPAALDGYDFTLVTVGYAVMRIPLVVQWLLRLLLPLSTGSATFVVLALAELAVPPWAERSRPTAWHPEHIVERYGLFTIIVLGEVILAATVAFQDGMAAALSGELVLVAVGGLLLMSGIWWTYFLGGEERRLRSTRDGWAWGYAHYPLVGSVRPRRGPAPAVPAAGAGGRDRGGGAGDGRGAGRRGGRHHGVAGRVTSGGADGGIRTRTGGVLSAVSLPVGVRRPAARIDGPGRRGASVSGGPGQTSRSLRSLATCPVARTL
jgi:low temperature requirement protein LtrA